MKVFHGFDSLPTFRHPVVTVGSYDGVHRGHRALLERLVAEARATGGESIVLTFDPHPRIALGRGEGLRLLTSLDEKIALLAASGVDCVIVIPFDRAFAALSGREFVERCLIGKVGAETLVAGYNHRFGHDRLDPATLPAATPLRIVRVDRFDAEGAHVNGHPYPDRRRRHDGGRATLGASARTRLPRNAGHAVPERGGSPFDLTSTGWEASHPRPQRKRTNSFT